MSKRKDITGKIFNDILVLDFICNNKTHAYYKCLCMICNNITNATYTNIKSGNTKNCQSCGQKISMGLEQDIYWELKKDTNLSRIARKLNVCRGTVHRIQKQYED